MRWGGDFQEAVAGMCVAAALAKLVDGVVFDEAEDRLLSAEDAIAVARQNLQVLLKPDDAKRRPGTRPADLKRYLKPLLKQRSDLVLIDRLLIVRPVRHLLRGVFFDRTSDRYEFRVCRCIKPLFAAESVVDARKDIHPVRWKVWEPHFEALLFDALAEDVFDDLGRMTTLGAFGRDLDEDTRIMALVLAGERERAAELIETERTQSGSAYRPYGDRERRALLERDVASLCAEFRAKESEIAEQLKLGDVWDPAPFPAEVPEAERAQMCDEPLFLTKPWIPQPPRLVEEPPDAVSEVRFARDVLRRKGSVVMFLPLTREEAEEKHEIRQDYALSARLPDQNLLVLHHRTSWNSHDPDQPEKPRYLPRRKFMLEIYGKRDRLLYAQIGESFDKRGVLKFWSMDVFDAEGQGYFWSAHNDIKKRTIIVWDHRNSPTGYRERSMTDCDLALCEFAEPPFGDFNDLWRRIETFLHNEGFGTVRDHSKSRCAG
ncbi:MAG: hypothetical protein WBW74_09855 [Xanthobacteraceae bacterium]